MSYPESTRREPQLLASSAPAGSRRAKAAFFGLFLAAGAVLGACQKSDEDVREWKPSDHDHTDQPGATQVAPAATGQRPPMAQFGLNEVILAAWKTNCTTCHGLIGRGDGPQGQMMRPPDLTHPTWQRAALDSEIKHTLKNGKGRMPAFGHLPDETIDGLIKLVRLLNRDASARPTPPANSAAPAAPNPPKQNPHAPQPPPTSPAPAQAAPAAPTAATPAAQPAPQAAPTPPAAAPQQ